MKMSGLVSLALLVAAVSVSAGPSDKPEMPTATVACRNCLKLELPVVLTGAAAPRTAPASGGRKLAGTNRKLLDGGNNNQGGDHGDDQGDDDNEDGNDNGQGPRPKHDGPYITSQTQYLTKLCPASGNAPYDPIVDSAGNPLYGQLVVDNGICGAGSANSSAVTYGSSAQDLRMYRPTWATYGWTLFKTPAALDLTVTWAWIQGINLQLVGVVGSGHDGSVCSVSAVSFAVFDAQQTGTRDMASNKPVYSKTINVTGGAYNHADFTWTQNTTGYFYTDTYDLYDDKVNALGFNLTTSRYYWLRVKLFTTATKKKRCFVYWATSPKVGNDAGVLSRWQEVAEVAAGVFGYSSTCTGAPASPANVSAASQAMPSCDSDIAWWNWRKQPYRSWNYTALCCQTTNWNCWDNTDSPNNNGTLPAVNNGPRRCLPSSPALPALYQKFCNGFWPGNGGQFNDFNFAMIGTQGQPGDGGGSSP